MGVHNDMGLTAPAEDQPGDTTTARQPAGSGMSPAAAAVQTARRRCRRARAAYRAALVAAGRRGRATTPEEWASLLELRAAARAVPTSPRREAR